MLCSLSKDAWRNEGAKGKEAFQDATTSKAQAVERNGNEENKRGKEREAAAKRHQCSSRSAPRACWTRRVTLKDQGRATCHVEREELKFSIGP